VTLSCEAFAKVNRSLSVLGRRPDGYHELDTVLQTIDLSDVLELGAAESLELTCDDPTLPAGEDNLVIRAARSLAQEARVPPHAAIRLVKRIPAGAGLGGGSADAAATLLSLRALWSLPLDDAALGEVAARLGSDIPFFLTGGLARGTGRGERIAPLPDPPVEWLVLLSPSFPLSTRAVYAGLAEVPPRASLTATAPASNLPGSDLGPFPDRNDLEPAAESLRQEVRSLRELLVGAGAVSARLSGSGSTVFGIFSSEEGAQEAARGLSGLPAGTAVRVVPTLPRADFLRRATPRPVENR
jgi:4-diphosphocytidyl-2-C-methyl-D-erythritol kinase